MCFCWYSSEEYILLGTMRQRATSNHSLGFSAMELDALLRQALARATAVQRDAAQVPALTSLVGVNTNPVPAHAPAAPPTATAGKRGQGAGAAHPAGSGHEGNAVGSPSLAAVVGSLASAEAALSKSLAQVCTFCSKCRTCSLRERIV